MVNASMDFPVGWRHLRRFPSEVDLPSSTPGNTATSAVELKRRLYEILKEMNLETMVVKDARHALARTYDLCDSGLDAHKDLIAALTQEIVVELSNSTEDVTPTAVPRNFKQQYLGTWSHPRRSELKAPATMDKSAFGKLLVEL